MRLGATPSYSEWMKNNTGMVDDAMARFAPPASAPAPEPAAQPAPTAAAQPAEPQASTMPEVRAATPSAERNPQRALEDVRGQRVEDQNAIAQSFQREGEAKAQAAEKSAQAIDAGSARARRYAEDADKAHTDNRAEQERARKWLAEDMETLRKPPVEPKAWQKAVGVLSGILGATAQAYLGDMGNGIAYGMGELQNFVFKNVREQLEEEDRAEKNAARASKYIDDLGKDSADEADMASKLAANHWFATSKELEKFAAEAKAPEMRESAQRLAIEATSQGRQILEKNYQEQVAAAKAAAAARAKKQLTPMEILKLEEQQLKNQGIALDNRKKANPDAAGGGAPAPTDREVVNPALWSSVNDTEKAKFRSAESAMQNFQRDANELEKMLKEHGTEAFGENSYTMQALQGNLLGSYKEIKELGALDNGVIELVDRAIGDPTSWWRGGGAALAKLKATRGSLKQGLESRAANLGLSDKISERVSEPDIRERPQGEPAPQPVRMVKDGKVLMVPPERAQAARNSGFVEMPLPKNEGALAAQLAASPAPVPKYGDMSDEEYEAQVRREQGYE